MSIRDRPWPWEPEPRYTPPKVAGDFVEAIAFGMADGHEGLIELTCMITSAIPDGVQFTARWTVHGTESCSIEVDHERFKLHQTFHRVDDGLEVEFGMLILATPLRRRGYTKRLIRNLTYAHDKLGVRHVTAFANDVDGAVAWAKLGAYPVDAEFERGTLLSRLRNNHRRLGIDESYVEGIEEAIINAPSHLLMRTVAALQGENGERLGEMLLKHHAWQAFWDLQNPESRQYL